MTKDEQEVDGSVYCREALEKIAGKRKISPGSLEFHTLDEIVIALDYEDERLGGRKEPFNLAMDMVSKLPKDAN